MRRMVLGAFWLMSFSPLWAATDAKPLPTMKSAPAPASAPAKPLPAIKSATAPASVPAKPLPVVKAAPSAPAILAKPPPSFRRYYCRTTYTFPIGPEEAKTECGEQLLDKNEQLLSIVRTSGRSSPPTQAVSPPVDTSKAASPGEASKKEVGFLRFHCSTIMPLAKGSQKEKTACSLEILDKSFKRMVDVPLGEVTDINKKSAAISGTASAKGAIAGAGKSPAAASAPTLARSLSQPASPPKAASPYASYSSYSYTSPSKQASSGGLLGGLTSSFGSTTPKAGEKDANDLTDKLTQGFQGAAQGLENAIKAALGVGQ